MSKFLDIILIAALSFNLYKIYTNYKPEMEILGANVPTWLAVVVQILCIILLGLKVRKNYLQGK